MKQNINIEAEGNELVLKNKAGDYVIIPKKYRTEVQDMIKEGCHCCIDNLVETLPVMEDYAEDGSLLPDWDKVESVLNPKNWGVKDYTDKGSRGAAYAAARQAGEKEFMWNNKRYNTNYKGTPEQQLKETGITDERLQGSSIIRKRIVDNIQPHGYGHNKSAIKAIIENKLEVPVPDDSVRFLLPTTKQTERYRLIAEDNNYFNNEYYAPKSENNIRPTHQDALNLTMGYPQKYNSFAVSEYKPSISKDKDKVYYKLNNESVKNNILQRALEQDFNKLKNKPVQIHSEINNKNKTEQEGALGTYTISAGKDDKGYYISYYDINDYSPIGQYIPGKDKNKINNPFGKPFEIYDRIYVNDYGKGLQRQYYNDEELLKINFESRNFDTLSLQNELNNRGIDLPKSKKYNVNSYFVPDEILKKYKINFNQIGEGGINVPLNEDEYKYVNQQNIKNIEREALTEKNNPYLKQIYRNMDDHIREYTERFKEYNKNIPIEEINRIKSEWLEVENNLRMSDSEYLKKYKIKHPELYKNIEYTVSFDGILGDETKNTLLEYRKSQNKTKQK